MEKHEIEKYEYCKGFINTVASYKEGISFKPQKYGCGSGTPNIEHTLDEIHRNLYSDIMKCFDKAKEKAEKIISEI